MRLTLLTAAVLMLLATVPAPAAGAEWSIEQILAQDMAGEFAVSPDGGRAVWVKRHLDEEGKTYRFDLFLSDLATQGSPAEPRQLTRGEAEKHSPRWSPDGQRIAYLSERDEKQGAQILLLDLRGGEAEELTKAEGGVLEFRWLDAGRLLYLAGENKTLRDLTLEEKGDESLVVGDEEHQAPARLFLLDIEPRKTHRVTADREPILDFEASPDGRWIVMRASRDLHFEYDYRNPPRILLWDLSAGSSREILEPGMHAQRFVWDKSSGGFYFVRSVSSDPTNLIINLDLLGYYELAADTWEAVDLRWERGISWAGIFGTEKGVLVDLFDGTRNRLLHLERKGRADWEQHFLAAPERGIVEPLAVGPDGKTALYGRTTASEPVRYFVAELEKDRFKREREFLKLNEFLADLPKPRTETIRWAGARGDTVEGILHYPIEYEAGRQYPLVLMLHGGPIDNDRDAFLEGWGGSPALMCARGALVLRPNYHGSAGYGLEWMESIKGHYYELEVPDVLAGVDHLVAQGLADEARLGVQGWSNGAILAIAACIAAGERFRVLGAGAGDVNWSSDYGSCSFGAAFDNAYLGGPPWEMPQVYVDKSPLFRIAELKVPTIIFFGTKDVNVAPEQGWQLYRALQQIGQTPVRFLLFPEEEHTLKSPIYRRRQMEEEMAWFDRHLFESRTPRNEALKPGSPLEKALRLADAARVGEFYGEEVEGLLVPELLDLDSLLVARFEVTRAQWRAYPKAVETAADSALAGNLPVTGVAFEAAQEYCRWLASRLGLSCRLPRGAELEGLRELAKGEENTLAWWAGYAVNIDDAARLAEKIGELEANRSLLSPVGSFAPAGETGLYDLNGNAAEWTLAADGAGKPGGLSAVTASDADAEPPPPPAYLGFRVVADKPAAPKVDQ